MRPSEIASSTTSAIRSCDRWRGEFARHDARFIAEATSPILNKIGRVLASPAIRNILAQPRSTIDLRRVMDEGRILIVNLSKGALGEGNAHLLGALLVTGIAHAALSRADTPDHRRRPFHLYADEFHSFATESFALVLSEARKYRLALTVGRPTRFRRCPSSASTPRASARRRWPTASLPSSKRGAFCPALDEPARARGHCCAFLRSASATGL